MLHRIHPKHSSLTELSINTRHFDGAGSLDQSIDGHKIAGSAAYLRNIVHFFACLKLLFLLVPFPERCMC